MDTYPYAIRLDGRTRYILWFSNDVDGVLLDTTGHILNFEDVAAARAYLSRQGLSCGKEAYELLDLEWIVDGTPLDPNSIDCYKTLAAWNFFADVAASVPEQAMDFRSKDRKPSDTYDKVFWGNNLPAVTPNGEHYQPEWSAAELEEISSILISGLKLLKSSLGSPAH